ncbi:MAG: VOC family protein, partial [Candidatus Binatia bacterium]
IYPEGSEARIEPELESALGVVSARSGGAGLSGIRRVVVAVRDLDAAVEVYRHRLGFPTVLSPVEPRANDRGAISTPGAGARIELLAPLAGDGPVARFLDERGEGMYALVLDSADLDSTVRALSARGVAVGPVGGDCGAWQIERQAAFGVLFRLEARPQGEEGAASWT